MKGSFSKEKVKQLVQEARQRIINAFAELKNKERLLRERAESIIRERKGGADPATS